MKFEKKVIIGSLGGFLTTIIGIIAVFFPSLLNFEKKNMEEIKIFIKSEADIQKFKKVILDNQGKLINLDLEYCYYPTIFYQNDISNSKDYFLTAEYEKAKVNNDDYVDKDEYDITRIFYGTIQTKEGLQLDEEENIAQGMVVSGMATLEAEGTIPVRTHGGTLILQGLNGANLAVNIPFKSDKKYSWDNLGAYFKDSEVEQKCIPSGIKGYKNEYEIPELFHEKLQGIFYVSDYVSLGRQSEMQFDNVVNLEPFNKKDLAIRDY
ncbi:hypothetical protein AVBRAN12642_02365 [Campylobacter sp. RM12642]|uniref:hypothetical protein n=1 Tax=unclassified Campylobacter TaxID=2593542 RepID=UPI001DEFB79A|nr:hypothetical protein [Campylobacter sp. RM12637]MBZ7979472.1 hypothetical protein [Campylobacter sp. RM12642]MBZ8006675.1 hypothetical protein [Campylobacter sp. RM9334]